MVGFSENLEAVVKRQTCNVGLLADEMGGKDKADFLAAVDSPDEFPAEAILRAVALGGYEQKVGKRSLKKHQEHRCVCFEVEG